MRLLPPSLEIGEVSTDMLAAVGRGQVEKVRSLLAQGIPVEEKGWARINQPGVRSSFLIRATPLEFAIYDMCSSVTDAFFDEQIACIRLLVDAGARATPRLISQIAYMGYHDNDLRSELVHELHRAGINLKTYAVWIPRLHNLLEKWAADENKWHLIDKVGYLFDPATQDRVLRRAPEDQLPHLRTLQEARALQGVIPESTPAESSPQPRRRSRI